MLQNPMRNSLKMILLIEEEEVERSGRFIDIKVTCFCIGELAIFAGEANLLSVFVSLKAAGGNAAAASDEGHGFGFI
jgi:hypothetical protein